MTDNTNKTTSDAEEQLGFDSDEFTDNPAPPIRREPVFNGFEVEEDYEEPERDTDYTSRYVEDDLEDDIDEQVADFSEADEPELEWGGDDDGPRRATGDEDPREDWQSSEDEGLDENEYPEYSEDAESASAADTSPPWEDEETYEGDYDEDDSKWPIGLVAVGLLAVILLAAGGYGVLQQRAAMTEEIRQLRAELATAVQPEEVIVDNSALEEAQKKNIELSMNMESLKLENRRLQDTVAGLEAQLDAQQQALSKPAPPPPKAKPTVAKPAAQAVASPESAGSAASWFVNFSSYSQRASAEDWAARLKPSSGRAVVTTGSRDGKTFYRVRIIELADKATAEKVARQLESQYGLSKLWVGK